MEKIKNFFKSQKNIFVVLFIIGTIFIILGIGTVFATTSIIKNSSIGKEKAQNFAFVDAGVDPAKAIVLSNKFDFEHGQFIYEIEFVSEGAKYEYCIKASDGSILEKEVEYNNGIVPDKGTENQNQTTTQVNTNQSSKKENQTNTKKDDKKTQNTITTNNKKDQSTSQNNTKQISLEEAKSKALSNAGISSSKATFTKTKLETEDEGLMYEIEFHTLTHKYEYEINAITGTIHKKETEKIKTAQNTNKNYIGVDKAKSIALSHAGVSSSSVTFKKAKLDEDDGMMIYEIEFYKGNIEYEYEINATTGKIIKSEIDDD